MLQLENMIDICVGPMKLEQMKGEIDRYYRTYNFTQMVINTEPKVNGIYHVELYIPSREFYARPKHG